MTFVPLTAPPARLCLLLYGDPSSATTEFALGFPKPGVVDPTGAVSNFATRFPEARSVVVPTVAATRRVITDTAKQADGIETLILDDFSTQTDRISAAFLADAKHIYYEQRKLLPLAMIRDALAFPGDIIVITRARPVFGKASDLTPIRALGGDERILVGTQPDIDDAVPYAFSLVVELVRDVDGAHRAVVRRSTIEGFATGEVIDNPTYALFAERLGRIVTVAEPLPLLQIQPHYPLNAGELMMRALVAPATPGTEPEAELLDEDPSPIAVAAAVAEIVSELHPAGGLPKIGTPIHLQRAS